MGFAVGGLAYLDEQWGNISVCSGRSGGKDPGLGQGAGGQNWAFHFGTVAVETGDAVQDPHSFLNKGTLWISKLQTSYSVKDAPKQTATFRIRQNQNLKIQTFACCEIKTIVDGLLCLWCGHMSLDASGGQEQSI